jgi:hypothetical protein
MTNRFLDRFFMLPPGVEGANDLFPADSIGPDPTGYYRAIFVKA